MKQTKPDFYKLDSPEIHTNADKLIINGVSKFDSEITSTRKLTPSRRYILKRKSDLIGCPIEWENGDEYGEVNEDL